METLQSYNKGLLHQLVSKVNNDISLHLIRDCFCLLLYRDALMELIRTCKVIWIESTCDNNSLILMNTIRSLLYNKHRH